MKEYVLIGVDGGATKVSAYSLNHKKDKQCFTTTNFHAQKKYADYESFDPAFTPVSISEQLDQFHKSKIKQNKTEERQALAYLQASIEVIKQVMQHFPGIRPLIGFGMPGLKTKDKRGIAVLANGPRIPEFSNILEQQLKVLGIEPLNPLHKLGSDADYCGIGEEYGEGGNFKPCRNAYYLGGGTGVADAIKLNNKLIPFDEIKPWIAKSWEMCTSSGISLEKYISARGIQYLYSIQTGIALDVLDTERIFGDQILKAALNNESAAIRTLEELSKNLAKLIFERITTVFLGWQGFFGFVSPQKRIEELKHPYCGIFLEKIIIGQRLGSLIEQSKSSPFLWKNLLDELTLLFKDFENKELQNYYLDKGKFDPRFITLSLLRAAPVIGAGVDAYFELNKNSVC